MARIRPDKEPDRLLLLQSTLLALAEGFFSARDAAFTIRAPRFNDRGPFVQHSTRKNELWIELSKNAAGYWPTAVFELAHESVHLLNPIAGYANTLEEGFAVAFQHYVAPALSGETMTTTLESYLEAERLTKQLHKDVFHAGKLIRQHIGAFSKATAQNMAELFPDAKDDLIAKLVAECRPRPR